VICHTTAGRFFEKSDIDSFLALVGNAVSPAQAKTDIQNYFRMKSRDLKVKVTTAEELIANMKKQMQIFSLLLGAIGSISLIVGGIGVMSHAHLGYGAPD
jgi:putative ABC transport system permease protein